MGGSCCLPACSADKHHKLFALFITSEGLHRRIDLIFVVPQSLPWGLLGWIGSKQYLRMLKQVSVMLCCEAHPYPISVSAGTRNLHVSRS
jgi:hypothetical protein